MDIGALVPMSLWFVYMLVSIRHLKPSQHQRVLGGGNWCNITIPLNLSDHSTFVALVEASCYAHCHACADAMYKLPSFMQWAPVHHLSVHVCFDCLL